jgi:hypothetical protein
MNTRPGMLVAAVLLLAATPLAAQDELGFEPEETIEVEDERPPAWRPSYEVLLRGDRVTGLPGGRADLERVRLRARAGVEWDPGRRGVWVLGAAVEGAIGTGANKRSLVNNDIEDVDGAGLDQLWLRARLPTDALAAHVELGKARLPLELTPMLWDDDLRPLGASLRLAGSVGDFSHWSLVAGRFEPDPLDTDGARFDAIQLGWEMPAFGESTVGARLAYLDWSGLNHYAATLGRGNTLVPRPLRYVFDYRLLDAQLFLRSRMGAKSLEARLDRVRNLDATVNDTGTRASLVYGDRFDPDQPGWEFGWSWQRIERDAVVAAVTADDWWFHTAARGHMPWIGYGFDETWSVRLAGFFETRDGLDERTRRVLLDVEARW